MGEQTEMDQDAQETQDPVFRVRLALDVYVQGKNEDAVRAEIGEMDMDQIVYEVNEGMFVAGTKDLAEVEQVPDDALDERMAAIGSDAGFFRM